MYHLGVNTTEEGYKQISNASRLQFLPVQNVIKTVKGISGS